MSKNKTILVVYTNSKLKSKKEIGKLKKYSFNTEADFKEFIKNLDIPQEAKDQLIQLTPMTYIGNAVEQANAI